MEYGNRSWIQSMDHGGYSTKLIPLGQLQRGGKTSTKCVEILRVGVGLTTA